MAHTLVGAALAEAGLKRRSRYATATLLIAANLPDIDAATVFIGADAALYFRRGWTHGVLAMLVLPVLLAGSVCLWHRWRGGGSAHHAQIPFRPGAILFLAFLGVWSHPLLDWLNTYGVRLLMPFDGTWFYGDTLFIIDPWLWLLTAAGLVLAHSHSRRALTGWAILLAVSSGLVLGSSFVADGTRLLWILGIAAIVALRLWKAHHSLAAVVARGGIGLLLLYIGTAYLLARGAESTLRVQFPNASVIQANPVPGNPAVHRLIVVE
ncbi:MAG: metal-dependent hydrolase, partial [Gammaproteobacteria bacterium]